MKFCPSSPCVCAFSAESNTSGERGFLISETMTYREQIRSPEWIKFAAKFKEDHDWKCESCGNPQGPNSELSVHHIYYTPGVMMWDHPPEIMECLCWPCHKKRQVLQQRAMTRFAAELKKMSSYDLDTTELDEGPGMLLHYILNLTAEDGRSNYQNAIEWRTQFSLCSNAARDLLKRGNIGHDDVWKAITEDISSEHDYRYGSRAVGASGDSFTIESDITFRPYIIEWAEMMLGQIYGRPMKLEIT